MTMIICPIMTAGKMANSEISLTPWAKCEREGCAWWNADAEGCGIVRNLAPIQECEGEDEADEPGEPFRVL